MLPDRANPIPVGSFRVPFALPVSEPDDGTLVSVAFSFAWLPYVMGALKVLLLQSTWDYTTQAELDQAQGQANNLLDIFAGYSTMTGQVSLWAPSALPAGWLACDGAAVSRTTYADLFAAIGTTYGPGDGSTTFNVPDLRGNVPIGAGSSYTLGSVGGEATHTLTTAEMPSHSHVDTGHTHTESTAVPTAIAIGVGVPAPSALPSVGVTGIGNASLANTGGDGAHNNLQPYLVVGYIIKF
jgi:microcystin-dependent protein